MRRAVFLAIALAFAAGCITSSLRNGGGENVAETKKLNLAGLGLTKLMELGIPIECGVNTSNGFVEFRIANGSFRTQSGQFVVIGKGTAVYMKVPGEMREELGCDWVMVNATENVFAEWRAQLSPVQEDFYAIPPANFDCDVDDVHESEFYVSGDICWFFDLKLNATEGT